MKNLIKSVTFIVLSVLFYDTANAQITYDLDKDANFSSFKTYSFGGWQKDSDKIINDIDKKRILESFKSELLQRGMDYKLADADVVITMYFVTENKTSTTAYTNFNGGMGMGYGYGMGYYRPNWGWGMGSSTTTYSENDYTVGTFIVDMYDTSSKKLIWQAVMQKTINPKANKRGKTIPKNVAKIMKKYPVQIKK
jgi:hypothetical protein